MSKNKLNSSDPSLRFPEFQGDGAWKFKKIGDLSNILKGKGISKSDLVQGGMNPCIRYGELYTVYGDVILEVKSSTNVSLGNSVLSKKNDVIIPSSGETKIDIAKASCVLRDDVILGGDLNIIRSSQNGIFLSYYINGPLRYEIAKVAQGNAVVHLYPAQIEQLDVAIPPKKKEQNKIADCLISLDGLITAQSHKVKSLKKYKKGLLQQLFPEEGASAPVQRFPEFKTSGEWSYKPLKELASRIITKNKDEKITKVLTNSASRGIVDQRDYFKKDIANKKNLAGYYIVDKGDYVYNPRISVNAPVGPISKNYLEKGVMSPLYSVFRFNNLENEFYAQFFKTSRWHWYLRSVSNMGARHDRMNVSAKDFLELPLPVTSPEEQKKITDFLLSFEDLIVAEENKLVSLRKHKKGLMQNLFPVSEEV